eukprot:g18607.t1
MLMTRSSSDPLAATAGHRRRASDSFRLPATLPPAAPAMLRRHCSCSASCTDTPPSTTAAALRLAPPAAPTASPTDSTPRSDGLSSPLITVGFNSSSVGASMPVLPEPTSVEPAAARPPPPPSPPRPNFTLNVAPVSSLALLPPPPAQMQEASPTVVGSDKGDESTKKADECGVSACVACLKTYFTGIVEAGFDGACPRMRCMWCPRVVCERAWAPLVEPGVLETFQRRAATLLTIQCGQCHLRGNVMVVPPADHSYSSAIETLMAEVGKALNIATAGNISPGVKGEQKAAGDSPSTPTAVAAAVAAATSPVTPAAGVASIDNAVDSAGKIENGAASSARNTELQEAFRTEFEFYTSGNQVDASPCYMAFEAVFRNPEVRDMDQESRDNLMHMLMNSVEDSERRSNLHIRFIRSNPMVTSKCCKALHCFRCRIVGSHAPLTCEQYEATRGHQDVCKCPGCGVYVVKGDGCSSITCICGQSFNWHELVEDRNLQVANAFRDAYPDNTGRLAAEIIRRGPPAAGTEAVEQARPDATAGAAAPASGNISVGDTGSTPVDGEEVPLAEEEQGEAIPAGNAPLSAEDNFRLANAYARGYPREIDRARADIYGEENPHFTLQRARIQRHPEKWRALAPVVSTYTGRPRRVGSPPSDAEIEWEATAAANWLTEHRSDVRVVEQREAAARLSMVEAFYGDDSRLQHNAAIAHTAAEHARAALRVATPLESPAVRSSNRYDPEKEESLFKWLGIVEPPPPQPPVLAEGGDGYPTDGEDDDEEEWTLPFAEYDYEVEEASPEVIQAPSSLWTPWPRGRLAPSPPSRATPDPATRVVSAVAAFGSVPMQREVELWVAGSRARQEQLRKLMAVEERELSKAWVALWGRRLRLDPSTKAWVDDSGDDDAALRSAARRVVFLEGHPEQVCREQAAMMKAFVRRNGAVVARIKEESDAELAAAWEKLHATEINLPSSATLAGISPSPPISMMNQAYEAYLRYTEANNSSSFAALSASPTSTTTRSCDFRRTSRMANAWFFKNLRWVRARRFADRFAGSSVALDGDANSDGNDDDASVAAVIALVVVPMLLGRSPLMCGCGMLRVISDAVDWVSFNQEAFEKELDRVDGKMLNGRGAASEGGIFRAIDGCECPERDGSSMSCARLAACPVVTRRFLRMSDPVCAACREDDDDDFLTGPLFDLFS